MIHPVYQLCGSTTGLSVSVLDFESSILDLKAGKPW